MWRRMLCPFVLCAFVLAACTTGAPIVASVPSPSPTQAEPTLTPTNTETPTSTPTETPTSTPTMTPTLPQPWEADYGDTSLDTLCLTVRQDYPQFGSEYSQPIKELAEDLLGDVGYQIVPDGDPCDATLEIQMTFQAQVKSVLMFGSYQQCYTGATVYGQMSLIHPEYPPKTTQLEDEFSMEMAPGQPTLCAATPDSYFGMLYKSEIIRGLTELFGPEIVLSHIRLADDESPYGGPSGLTILDYMDREELVRYQHVFLSAVLGDVDPGVRSSAALVLGQIGDPAAFDVLVQALGDADSGVQQAAVQALGGLGNPAAIDPLAEMLEADDAGVRGAAVKALAGFNTGRAYAAISGALDDEDASVRGAALKALTGPQAAEFVTEIAPLLQDEDDTNRLFAVLALEGLGPEAVEALPALISALEDSDRTVRQWAASAIGSIGHPSDEALAALTRTLTTDEERVVRANCARALGSLRDPRAIEALIQALDDDADLVRRSAASAIGYIGYPLDEAIAALVKTLTTDEERDVRASCADALGNLGDPRALEALIQALDDDENVRLAAVDALRKLGSDASPAIPLLIEAMRDADRLFAVRVADALRSITGESFGEDYDAWRAWWESQS